MPRLVLIRHARPRVDPVQPVATWGLTEEGLESARALARNPAVSEVSRFFTSPEPKAVQTARVLARARPIEEVELLRELDRSDAGWVGDDAAYVAMIEEVLRHPTRRVHHCESAVEAQRRINLAVEGLRAAYPDEIFAIVSGGIVLALYLAAIQNLAAPDPAMWRAIGMPDLAVVDPEGGRVIQGFAGHLLA